MSVEEQSIFDNMQELNINDHEELMSEDDFYISNLIFNFIQDDKLEDEKTLEEYILSFLNNDEKFDIECVEKKE
jgi:hypothetical protein